MRILKHTVNEVCRQIVTKHNLLDQAIHYPEHGKTEHAVAQIVFLVKLRYNVTRLDTRAGNHLREDCHLEAKIKNIATGLHQPFIHIGGITNDLECVE